MIHDYLSLPALLFNTACLFILAMELWLEIRDRGVKNKTADQQTAAFINGLMFSALLIGFLGTYFRLGIMAKEAGMLRFNLTLSLILVWAGALLRFWAIFKLGRLFHPVVIINKGQPVIDSGPYKYIRHPSYLAVILVIMALFLVWNTWFGLISLFLACLAYELRVRAEETALKEVCGKSYEDYMKRTRKFLPFLY